MSGLGKSERRITRGQGVAGRGVAGGGARRSGGGARRSGRRGVAGGGARRSGRRHVGRAGRCAGRLVLAPAGDGGVQVEREDHVAVGRLGGPVLGGHPPHDLELDAAGVLGVQRLGHPVVALPHQRAGRGQLGPRLGQVGQRADLPGQVVQPGVLRAIGCVADADLEQAEVVVVGRTRGAQERGPAGDLQPDLEAQGGSVEVDGLLQTVHVEDSVVQAPDGHLRFLPSANR